MQDVFSVNDTGICSKKKRKKIQFLSTVIDSILLSWKVIIRRFDSLTEKLYAV